MIIVKNLTKHILGQPLFEKVSFVINKNDKIGLIGVNGSGKSTLIKIILGEVEADSGSVDLTQARIGYLPQQLAFQESDTISAFLNSPKNQMVLEKVGLSNISQDFEIRNLSGGQKTRLALAKVLLSGPNILILDEPTNHLDMKGLEWLEKFIKSFNGAAVVISHDRTLLDNCVERILEIDHVNMRFNEYHGGYSVFSEQKKKALAIQEQEYKLHEREKNRLERWLILKKQEASVHPDPAKGKQIRAMEKRLEREIHANEIAKPKNNKIIRGMDLKGEASSSKLILRCKKVSKKFGEKKVLSDISFEIRGGERVLLSGANGSGKTTLLKIINGQIDSDSGEVKIGDKVRIGYFAQEHEDLDMNKTVIDEYLSTKNLFVTNKDPRNILGAFLFKGQDVFKKVSDLSLGERVRLVFAKLTNQENEFLVLDEPTNHLDISSREIIENALVEFKGAILAVSHDRYFIEKIGFDSVLSIDQGRKRVHSI
jgi:ATPase subunit of ABC transporter with duplicated ATPase domains